MSFLGSLILWFFFQKSTGSFQFVVKLFWLPTLNLNFTLGIDGISIFFLLLTTLLIPLCILTSWNSVGENLKEFLIAFLVLDFFLIGTFCVLDLLLFYIFFESVLPPMFLIVGVWGSRERKILAAYYFFFYTLLGSVLICEISPLVIFKGLYETFTKGLSVIHPKGAESESQLVLSFGTRLRNLKSQPNGSQPIKSVVITSCVSRSSLNSKAGKALMCGSTDYVCKCYEGSK